MFGRRSCRAASGMLLQDPEPLHQKNKADESDQAHNECHSRDTSYPRTAITLKP